jgi:hypothetical protein
MKEFQDKKNHPIHGKEPAQAALSIAVAMMLQNREVKRVLTIVMVLFSEMVRRSLKMDQYNAIVQFVGMRLLPPPLRVEHRQADHKGKLRIIIIVL